MKLYEINDAYYNWLTRAQEAEGELTPEMLTEIDCIEGEFEEKGEAYAVLIKTLNAEAEMLKTEQQRLYERQKQKENLAERLKERLAESMRIFERDKLETAKCKISFRSSRAVEIVDEAKLPDEYFKIERKPMKSEIKEALKAGVAIDGAVLVERKNIQIK